MKIFDAGDEKTLREFSGAVPSGRSIEEEPSHMVHEQLARLKFIQSLISMENKRILDFGCGTGYSSFYLSEKNRPRKIVGLDIDKSAVGYSRKYYSAPGIEYIVGDCLVHNPLLGSFDVIISNEVIEHVHNSELFLRVLGTYLAPDGSAIISTPNKGVFSLSKNKSFLNDDHVNELFYDEFRKLLEDHFTTVACYSQVLKISWHSPFINYLSAQNVINAIKSETSNNIIIRYIASKFIKYLIFILFFVLKSKNYPDIRKIRYKDFEFTKDFDNRAIWFVAIVSHPKSHK